MSKRRGRRTRGQEKLARVRIERLFMIAEKNSNEGNFDQSKRVIELAQLISKRYNQRLTKLQRLKICRKCNSFFNSSNSRNRLSPNGWKIITCLECNNQMRFSLKK